MLEKTFVILILTFGCFSCSQKISSINAENTSSKNTSMDMQFIHKPEEKKLEVLVNGVLFTNYLYPDNIAKPILYPLLTSKGTVLTRGYPIDPKPGERADHPHHIGFWLNYGNVNGLDFWNNPGNPTPEKKDKYGQIVHRSIENINEKEGHFEVLMDWKTPGEKVLLTERTQFKFEQSDNIRSIIRITTLTAGDQRVYFQDNKEGMLGIRVVRSLELPRKKPGLFINEQGVPAKEKSVNNENVTGNYLSSEGLEGDDVWGTRAKWVKLYGQVEEKDVSITIFDHPDNIGYPTYWHARGYGLFAANPLGQKIFSKGQEILDFKLEPGESVTFKHKILLLEGEQFTMEELNQQHNRFSKM